MTKEEHRNHEIKLVKKRREYTYMASLAHDSKRREDQLGFVRKLIKLMRSTQHWSDLVQEEKNLFNSAYKNIIVAKRKQWRGIIEIMDREEKKADDARNNFKFKCINEMKETIEDEVRELCKEWYIEAKYFLRHAYSSESRVFYMKIKADTFRYLA